MTSRARTTLLLLLLAGGLGAYIYFVEMERDPSDTETPADRVFSSLEADDITSLTLQAANGDATTVQREEGAGWRITAPIDARADATEVAGVTSNLTTLDLSRVIDEAPADLAPFGLDSPRIVVSFTTGGGTERLLVGERTATGGDIYAKLDSSPRVFLIPSWLESSLDRTTFQLRDKAIVLFDRPAVDALSIIGVPGTIEIVKKGGRWMLHQPMIAAADEAAVDTVLNRLASGQMQAVVAEQPATLDVYGLAPPRTTVTASSGGSVIAQVLVGSASGDTAVHMKDQARQVVFTVEPSLVEDLERAAGVYRNTRLLSDEAMAPTSVTVTRGDRSWVFEQTRSGDQAAPASWTQASPAPVVPSERIAEFVSRLPTLRAASWEARVPRDATAFATITVVSAGNVTETVRLVQAGDTLFATREDEPGAARVATSTVEELLALLEEGSD